MQTSRPASLIPHLRLLAALILACACLAPCARAAAPYQGIYVILDPYDRAQVRQLTDAVQNGCTQGAQTAGSPFCGAANGMLLRFPWCDFQLYHVAGPSGAYPSCHYVVGFSGGSGSPGAQIPATDTISPCQTQYDVCAGSNTSVLGATLALIAQLDTIRATVGLAPVALALGMYAGVGTAQSILDSVGSVDVPHNTTTTGAQGATQCYRLPLVWTGSFAAQYDAAFDELLAYVKAQLPHGANVTIAKSAAIVGNDLEIEMPGKATPVTAPADPGPAGPGAALRCSSTLAPAQVWLGAYNRAPSAGRTFSQAVEYGFGFVIGHQAASLANAGLPAALLSIATNNTLTLANVDCGLAGASQCSVQPGSGDWSNYYFELYVNDLFNGGLAHAAAAAGYQAIRNTTFSLSPQAVSVNATGLALPPINSAAQIECTLNNTDPAHAQSFILNGASQGVLGAGTVLGWQTRTGQGHLCAAGTYGTVLDNGIQNGALFEEVEPDAAFTDIARCAPYLTDALAALLAQSPPTVCQY